MGLFLNFYEDGYMLKTRVLRYFLVGLSFFPTLGFCCTDFMIKTQDNAHIVGRSLEFGQILSTEIQVIPKGQNFESPAPKGQKGLSWTNKYAFMGIVFKPAKALLDGFNEKGLSVEMLWMPGTQYPTPPSDQPILFFADVGSWLLGNFGSVEEATSSLSKVNIYAAEIPGFPSHYIPPIHLALNDDQGKSAVVEFLNGKMHIFENPVSVLTNAPEFPWHLTNLRNYINLSAFNVGPLNINGTVLEPTGQGTGLLGIPGDWTPPSRFVRAAILKQTLIPPIEANAGALAVLHILNTFDIPYGTIRTKQGEDFDFTQWIVIKDLTNQRFFYRTYGDPKIYMLDLKNTQWAAKTVELDIKKP